MSAKSSLQSPGDALIIAEVAEALLIGAEEHMVHGVDRPPVGGPWLGPTLRGATVAHDSIDGDSTHPVVGELLEGRDPHAQIMREAEP